MAKADVASRASAAWARDEVGERTASKRSQARPIRPGRATRRLIMVRHGLLLRLLGMLAVVAVFYGGSLTTFRNAITDARFGLAKRPASGRVVLVEIDAASLAALGAWPWSRRIYAGLVDRLHAAGAADIAFDIDFSAPRDQAGDTAFREALDRAGGTTILAALQQRNGHASEAGLIATHPLPIFRDAAWEASVNVEPDEDGLIRVLSRGHQFGRETMASLPYMLAGGSGTVSGTYAVDYGIDRKGIDRLSAANVAAGRFDPDRVRDRKVIIGATAIELRDYYQVPRYGPIPGALLQAIAAESLLQGRDLQPVDPAVSLAICLALLILAWLCRGFDMSRFIVLSAAVAAAVEIGAVALQRAAPLMLDTSPIHAELLVLTIIAVMLEIDGRRIKILVSRANADRLRAILDRVIADNFAGIVVVDQNGTVRALSRAAAMLLGVDQHQAGRHAVQILPAELQSVLQDTDRRIAAGDALPTVPSEIELQLGADREPTVLEYVTTVSIIPGALDDSGRRTPDQRVVCLTFQDVTERHHSEGRIERLAHFDPLTGLANRHSFVSSLEEALVDARSGGRSVAVLFLDLDGFKVVNDRLGNLFGDMLLLSVASRIRDTVHDGDVAARLGSDEYALILERADPDAPARFAEEIVPALTGTYDLDGYQVMVGVSVGLAVADGSAADELMKRADAALSAAKASGGGCMRGYDAALAAMVEEGRLLELDLREAIGRNELQVFYQRQVDAVSEAIVGVEALVRWKHPRLGYVPPVRFIPIAERTGIVEEIGAWVLREACREAMLWPRPIKVSVNLSAVQLSRGDLVQTVAGALAESGLPPGRLDLELTESLLMENTGFAHGVLGRLRELGVGLSLDDFGTGYSSLAYLKSFDIDKIKIDRSFVKDLPEDESSIAIIRAVVTLAEALGLRVNTEGVETAEQMATVRDLGCHEIQGFLHGRPEPSPAIVVSLRAEMEVSIAPLPLAS